MFIMVHAYMTSQQVGGYNRKVFQRFNSTLTDNDNPPIKQERYKIGGQIGSGSWGRVFYARDRETQQVGAVKVIELGEISSKQAIDRGLRIEDVVEKESRGSGKNYPGILTRFLERDDDGKPFLWMPGRHCDLNYVLLEGDFARSVTAVKLALIGGAFRGLESWHNTFRVAHCDIKPSNILVDCYYSSFLSDFGCSTRVTNFKDTLAPRDRIGEASIRAPELFLPGSRPTYQSDVYSLGTTLFYVLTGRNLRQGRILKFPNFDSAMTTLTESEADKEVWEETRSLPRSICTLLRRALAFDPRKRHSGGAELHQDFTLSQMKCNSDKKSQEALTYFRSLAT